MSRTTAIICEAFALLLAIAIAVLATAGALGSRANATEFRHWDRAPAKQTARKYVKRRHSDKARIVSEQTSSTDATVEIICADLVRGLGTQWIGTSVAMEAAKKDWMERVRYDLGESFLDLSHAQDFKSRCGRTSIGETAGQVFYRCEILARPCKGIFKQGENK